MEILTAAHKHDVAAEDILYALRKTVSDYPNQGDHELTMAVDPTCNGVTMGEAPLHCCRPRPTGRWATDPHLGGIQQARCPLAPSWATTSASVRNRTPPFDGAATLGRQRAHLSDRPGGRRARHSEPAGQYVVG